MEVKDGTLVTNKLRMRTKGWGVGTWSNERVDDGGGLPKIEKHASRSLTFVVGGGDLCKMGKHKLRYWTSLVSRHGPPKIGKKPRWTWMTKQMRRWNRMWTRTWVGM